jgi:hypothetical protein
MTETAEPFAWDEEVLLWLAREMVRNGELRLAGQLSSLQAMEARATSLVTWSAGALVALAAGASQQRMMPLLLAASPLLLASAICAGASLLPKNWHYAGMTPEELRGDPHPTERLNLEAVAGSLHLATLANDKTLERFATRLKRAWMLFLAAGAVGALAAVLFRP